MPAWRVMRSGNGFLIELPSDWLAANPWTAAAFKEESAVWKQIGREYIVKSKPTRKPV
jgi:exopolyphosphatase/guanosine-5'-triphosphate,3'-diphosphate pyrophosphatase